MDAPKQLQFVLFFSEKDILQAKQLEERLTNLQLKGCLHKEPDYEKYGFASAEQMCENANFKLVLITKNLLKDTTVEFYQNPAIKDSTDKEDGSLVPIYDIPREEIPEDSPISAWKFFPDLEISDPDYIFKNMLQSTGEEKACFDISDLQSDLPHGDDLEEQIVMPQQMEDSKKVGKSTEIQQGEKEQRSFKLAMESGHYNMKDDDVMISIPDNIESTAPEICIMLDEVDTVHKSNPLSTIVSKMITMVPHGALFDKHILIRFPIFPVKKGKTEETQLKFSEDGKKDWVSLEQNDTSVFHRDDMFWYTDDKYCHLFTRHFSCVFFEENSSVEKQQAIYLQTSLHGLLHENVLEFTIGFHCPRCHDIALKDKNELGLLIHKKSLCVYQKEGPLTVELDVDGEEWKCKRPKKEIDPSQLMPLCKLKDLYTETLLLSPQGKCTDISGLVTISQGSMTKMDIEFIESITKFQATLSICSKPGQKKANSTIGQVVYERNPAISVVHDEMNESHCFDNNTCKKEVPLDQVDHPCGSLDDSIGHLENLCGHSDDTQGHSDCGLIPFQQLKVSNDDKIEKFDDDKNEVGNVKENKLEGAVGGGNIYYITKNYSVYNMFHPMSPATFNGLPCQQKESDCIFFRSLMHEQKELCRILDNDYKEKLPEIAKRVGDSKNEMDSRNITGLVLLQMCKANVVDKDKAFSWRDFYDILLELNCEEAAQQLKVVYEKEQLLDNLKYLQNNFRLKGILGKLISKNMIDPNDKEILQNKTESDAVLHLVTEILMKTDHEYITTFQQILEEERNFKKLLPRLMLCPPQME